MRVRPSTWGKLTLGVLVIGGTMVALWGAFRPAVDPVVEVTPPPRTPPLRDARAVVRLGHAGSARQVRATITCDGAHRAASGFWARRPAVACHALAATRAALLAGARCPRPRAGRTTLRVTGRFGARRFDHRVERLGCPSVQAWLAVNALVAPVIVPERAATDAGKPSG
jgi:hypothetical protein